jgi:DNA-binding NarL/FixJ family response regulator
MACAFDVPPAERTRVVIADDDPLFAEMLRGALATHEQFEIVDVVRNGADAVAAVRALNPALVLMDVAMPVMDGIEATRQMQELDDPPAVVLITADASDAEDRRAYAAGAAAFLRKTQELVSVIDVIVALSRVTGAPT